MAEALLSVQNLYAGYEGQSVLRDVSFDVPEGGLISMLGPNGHGKTTLLRCIAGLFTEEAGSVRVRPPERPLYLGHKPGVNPMLSALENIRWYLALEGLSRNADVCQDAIDAVGLGGAGHVPCATLSAGQRRRAALARLAVTGTSLWLLDEPFAALDDAGRELVRSLVGRHRDAGGAVLCATHESLGVPDAGRLELPG